MQTIYTFCVFWYDFVQINYNFTLQRYFTDTRNIYAITQTPPWNKSKEYEYVLWNPQQNHLQLIKCAF